MASLPPKLLRNPLPFRILTSLSKSHPTDPPFPPLCHCPNPRRPCPPETVAATQSHRSLLFYPSFTHWAHLESTPPSGFDRPDAEIAGGDLESGDAGGDREVWADSVKKKRKTKMNKHKYRKLRKRLRLKT